MSHGDNDPHRWVNPYSDMAVARFTDPEQGSVDTVPTDAVRDARTYLDEYLRSPATGRGTVIAIVGDYGTGKTHLANHLLYLAREHAGDPVRTMHLYAAEESFVDLYQRFVKKVDRSGVRALVNQYYADFVAESLQRDGLTSDMFSWLDNREQEPQQIVERMGLMESVLLRRVQEELGRVTHNDDFTTAFSLLLRPGFDESVWSWLSGAAPDRVLQERGVTSRIDEEVAALEALGVFALLFGGRQRRCVLVIDEMHRIFVAGHEPRNNVMSAFQTLLEKVGDAGACLVLCGLPDFIQLLDESVQERISHTVPMGRLSNLEVRELMEMAHRAAGLPGLKPFTAESAGYLNDLAQGNVRDVIRICHRAYRLFDDECAGRGTISVKLVREAAQDLFGAPSSDEIDNLVRQTLLTTGWELSHQHILGRGKDSTVDFWITFPGREGGCAIVITGALLTQHDLERVKHRIAAIKLAAPAAVPLVVVNGVSRTPLTIELERLLGHAPLTATSRAFADNLTRQVGAIGKELGGPAEADQEIWLRQQLGQIHRQQASFFDQLERLGDHVEAVRRSSDHQLAGLRRQLAALTEPVGPDRALVALPTPVEDVFRTALDKLDELTHLDVMLADAFAGPVDADADLLAEVQRRIRTADYSRAAGLAELMAATLRAFRAAIAEFYATDVKDRGGQLSDAADDRLQRLCRIYDGVMEFLPIFELYPLLEIGPWTVRDGIEGRRLDRNAVHEALAYLAPRVRRAVVQVTASSTRRDSGIGDLGSQI